MRIFLLTVISLCCIGAATAGKDKKYSKEVNEKYNKYDGNRNERIYDKHYEKEKKYDKNYEKDSKYDKHYEKDSKYDKKYQRDEKQEFNRFDDTVNKYREKKDKYEEKNANQSPFDDDYRPPKNYKTTTERLFRMQKIQNIWQKGQQTLNEAKLKSLYHDLKAQDKQEVEFKRVKGSGKDKSGMDEAALRNKLTGIMESYGLTQAFPEHGDASGNTGVSMDLMFKDKKLNKLWNKIEQAGLDEKEMKIFKEELDHHQDKLDQYYSLIDNLHQDRKKTPHDENKIDHFLEEERDLDSKKQAHHFTNDEMRIQHMALKDNYDQLASKIYAKLNEKEFTDEKAIKLWEMAKKADLSKDELDSLRGELHHFEHRIRKLHIMQNEMEMKDAIDSKTLKNKLESYEKKIEKVHNEIHGRLSRRVEL